VTVNTGKHVGRRYLAVDNAEDMERYDQLPRPVREALAYHPDNLAVAPIFDFWTGQTGPASMDSRDRFHVLLKALQP
jgi:hypothetical protein